MSNSISHTAKEFADAIQKQVQQDIKDSMYAAQQALNNTAFKARENLLTSYQNTFDIHKKSFFNHVIRGGVKVKKANYKKDGMDMSVDLTFPHDWFKFQALGGVKKPEDQAKPKNYKTIAIPTLKGVGGGAATVKNGKITGSHAGKLIEYHLANPKKTVGYVEDPHAFILKRATPKGYDVIARRKKTDRKKLQFFYILVPEHKINKKWDFYGIIQKTFDRHLDKEFDKALKWCLEHPKK